jgi:hypothetical protein
VSDPLTEVTRDDDGQVQVKPLIGGDAQVKATPLTDFLQMDNPTSKEQDQLKEVWEYVLDSTKSELRTEQLMAIRHIEQRLAPPRLGQTRLDQLYQYVKLDKQAKSVEKLRDSFLR